MMSYFHGCPNSAAVEKIVAEGAIRPRVEKRTGFLAPVAGRVYLTRAPGFALIHALGGDIAGHEMRADFIERDGPYGCVFEVKEAALRGDLQPDEDEVGKLLSDMLYGKGIHYPGYKEGSFSFLVDLARRHYKPETLMRVKYGEYIWFARVGKGLLQRMSDHEKRALLASGLFENVSYKGSVPFQVGWLFDKREAPRLRRDAGNLSEFARQIFPGERI